MGVRKTDTSGVQSWIFSFNFIPVAKSLAIDSTENDVLFAKLSNPIQVFRFSASTGNYVSYSTL